MPIYEYRCESCGRQHEALQKVSDRPLRACPSCGKKTLKRLMSAPRFRLKGAGWYETDFKSDKETKRNLAESGGEAASASTGEGSSAGASSGEKSGDGKAGKSESGEKSEKPAAAGAEGKGGAGPSAVRKPTAARSAVRKASAARKPAGARRRSRFGRA